MASIRYVNVKPSLCKDAQCYTVLTSGALVGNVSAIIPIEFPLLSISKERNFSFDPTQSIDMNELINDILRNDEILHMKQFIMTFQVDDIVNNDFEILSKLFEDKNLNCIELGVLYDDDDDDYEDPEYNVIFCYNARTVLSAKSNIEVSRNGLIKNISLVYAGIAYSYIFNGKIGYGG